MGTQAIAHALLQAVVEVSPSGGDGATSTILLVVVAVVGSGGVLGAVVAFFKLRPEKDSIVVTSAQGALLMQTGIAEELRKENARLTARNTELERCVSERDATISRLEGRADG